MGKSMGFAAGAAAAFMALAASANVPPSNLLGSIANESKSCDGDMPFRAGLPVTSTDKARPRVMVSVAGNVLCLADPVPPMSHTEELAYLTARLAPAHVLNQISRGPATPALSFNYRGNRFDMQLREHGREDKLFSAGTVYCHDYDFVNRTLDGKFLAAGEMKVCVPEYRQQANNLPVPPLALYMAGGPSSGRTTPAEPKSGPGANYGPATR